MVVRYGPAVADRRTSPVPGVQGGIDSKIHVNTGINMNTLYWSEGDIVLSWTLYFPIRRRHQLRRHRQPARLKTTRPALAGDELGTDGNRLLNLGPYVSHFCWGHTVQVMRRIKR